MKHERNIARFAAVYARLIRLHPGPFRAQFGAQMEQLFLDCLRERAREGRSVVLHALWMCAETAVEAVRQRAAFVMQHDMYILRIGLVTLALLLIPALAMQVTDEVDWSLFDFVFAGTAIFSTGLVYVLVARRGPGTIYRWALALALVSALLLVWVNGAVGLIGSETDDFNALYGVELVVGLAGAALAWLEPRGMAWAMVMMASTHGLVGAAALLAGKHGGSLAEAIEVAGVTGLFMVPFLGSAWLFRRADRGQRSASP